MNKLKSFLSIFGLIVKYSAVVMAVIKGLEVMNDELKKLDLDDSKIKENE